MTAVADELDSAAGYEADFGGDAPPAHEVASELRAASAWAVEEARAERSLNYVKTTKQRAWDAAMTTADRLQNEFNHALATHPELADHFPRTNGFFAVRSELARKGAETRAKNAKKRTGPPPAAGGAGGS